MLTNKKVEVKVIDVDWERWIVNFEVVQILVIIHFTGGVGNDAGMCIFLVEVKTGLIKLWDLENQGVVVTKNNYNMDEEIIVVGMSNFSNVVDAEVQETDVIVIVKLETVPDGVRIIISSEVVNGIDFYILAEIQENDD